MSRIAFFDFDGTITSKDSLVEFIKFALGVFKYYKGLLFLSPILILFKLKFIPNDLAKEKLITYFFSGFDSKYFFEIASRYSKDEIPKIVRPKAIEKIIWHKQAGDKVVIVSASMESWLKCWCNENGVELLGTKLQVEKSKITGRFSSKNCYGLEKVHRIREKYNLDDYKVIYAYGDTMGDQQMLDLADKKYYKHFN